LPFYEEVVLRRLINSGVRHNVVLMDAQQYAVSLSSHPPRLAGRSYTLMPVRVPGKFHPKLIFLAGKKRGLVIIGSHNLTLAGFGFNRELTNFVHVQNAEDLAAIAVGRQVWNEVEHWLIDFSPGVPHQVIDMVRRVKDFAPWLKVEGEPDANLALLAGRPGERTLWEQLQSHITGPVSEVILGGAFFDAEGRFLEQVMRDLQPQKMVVGIDPSTVQISESARAMSGADFVNAAGLGAEDQAKQKDGRYLHAKAIYLTQEGGRSLFASGSANPSRPAWLADRHSGNAELMLVRLGAEAEKSAESTGFSDLAKMPKLSDGDWEVVRQSQNVQIAVHRSEFARGIAVVDEERILADLKQLKTAKVDQFVLCAEGGAEIARTERFSAQGEIGVVELPGINLANAFDLRCLNKNDLKLVLLLHHAREVEEQARTGVQRRFKEALSSLGTDTPNIALLIDCIDKIIFSDEVAIAHKGPRQGPASRQEEDVETPTPETLAIDVSEVRKRKSKHRLHHTGDFGYLLDTLIYHLRIHEDKSMEELDHLGRSEEEQVGSDDEEDHSEKTVLFMHGDILKVCHTKVHTLVNRMAAQLHAYLEGRQPLDKVLTRLLGVLAVLRELRRCDKSATWVEKGKTTVPAEERLRLLEDVMFSLFEGKQSILLLDSLGEEFADSDDIARLKGLLLLLAWDCGLTLDLSTPFMESREQLNERLRENAMMLALAQMVCADEVVIDEARHSIGSLTSSELDWLLEIQHLAKQCDAVREGAVESKATIQAVPGDIAVHRTLKNLGLRIVGSNSGNQISLIRLDRKKDRINYVPDHLRFTAFPSRTERSR
jgi:hypothetical protein